MNRLLQITNALVLPLLTGIDKVGSKGKVCSLLLLAIALVSCSSEDDPLDEEITPQIIFLFSPGGLGDMSYNDCILEGVQQFKKAHPAVDVFMYSPPSLETAERIFSDWMKRPGSNIPVVFALASSDFEPIVDKYVAEYDLTDNKRILLFESLKTYADKRIHTFQISMYGASYLAGVTAGHCPDVSRSLILLGSSSDKPIESAMDGFIDGYGSSSYDVEYLSDDWTGYVMANLAYQKMSEWASKYGFIFPVAGGSNAGIYRYTREFKDASPYLAGMDIDQSSLSTKITGSVVKHFDKLVNGYFTEWLLKGTMPESQVYGLESGYVDWLLSPLYEDEFRQAVEDKRLDAIEREKGYYEIGN